MEGLTLDGHHGRVLSIDVCYGCHAIWFDMHESLALTPGSTLRLFRLIGEKRSRPQALAGGPLPCPRCSGPLRRTHDMQRATRFEYWRCAAGHGRFVSFFDFLREKDFIRPLTPPQIAELRQVLSSVNCSNCGAPVAVVERAACAHCGAVLSMLDLAQAERLVAQLQKAEDRASQPVDPGLPLAMLQARRETERAFAGLPGDEQWLTDVRSFDLVSAGLGRIADWFRQRS